MALYAHLEVLSLRLVTKREQESCTKRWDRRTGKELPNDGGYGHHLDVDLFGDRSDHRY